MIICASRYREGRWKEEQSIKSFLEVYIESTSSVPLAAKLRKILDNLEQQWQVDDVSLLFAQLKKKTPDSLVPFL